MNDSINDEILTLISHVMKNKLSVDNNKKLQTIQFQLQNIQKDPWNWFKNNSHNFNLDESEIHSSNKYN